MIGDKLGKFREEFMDQQAKKTLQTDVVEVVSGTTTPISHFPQDDLAAQYADDLSSVSSRALRSVKWKTWMIVVPLQTLIYFCYYADKITTSNSSVMGFQEDLDMNGHYNWVSTSFYLGYLVFVAPVSYALHRFRIAKVTGALVVSWGIVVACMGAAQTFRDMLGMRVLAGALISGVTPSMVLITAMFFPANEQWASTTVWYCGVGLGQFVCDWVAYGCFKPEFYGSELGIASWRILFIAFGCFTVLVGIAWLMLIPDVPTEAWWLTKEEKQATLLRIRGNQQGFGTHKWKWYQAKEAFLDPRTWIYFIGNLSLQIGTGGVISFSVITISSLGYNDLMSLAMDSIGGAVDVVAEILFAFFSLHFLRNYRSAYGIPIAALNVMSLALLAYANDPGALSGYYLWGAFEPMAYTTLLSFISSDAAGSTKKVVAAVILQESYAAGACIGPQTYIDSEAPHYPTAKRTMMAFGVVAFASLCAIPALNFWENKRRDRKGEKLPPGVDPEFADLTDKENPEFRYSY